MEASEFKQTCIKCTGDEFTDMFLPDGTQSPARKCNKCGLICTMFGTKL